VQREVARGASIANVAELAGKALDTADELDALAKLTPQEQQQLIEPSAPKKGDKVSAKTAAKQSKRNARERELANATSKASKKVGTKLYGVIYAEIPPWRLEPYSRETGLSRAADNHYPTMTIEQITASASAASVQRIWRAHHTRCARKRMRR
jgi:hypothetical protein